MGASHYIETKIPFDFDQLKNTVVRANQSIQFEQREENLCYFWLDKTSTRGVEVSFENGFVELRNTVMSNEADFQLTNSLAEAICSLFQGQLFEKYFGEDDEDDFDEDEAIRLVPADLPVYTQQQMVEKQQQDTHILRAIITQRGAPITLFGPIRKTHFGVDFMNAFKDNTLEELVAIMHNRIKKVNYRLPDYGYGNIMETGEGDNIKTLKLLTNKTNCIIDAYDYILFRNGQDAVIAITNDVLNTILPESWKRVDEYTIVAPILPDDEFNILIANATPYDCMQELNANR